MPFTISQTGKLSEVLAAAKNESEKQHKLLGKNKTAEESKKLLDSFLDSLRKVITAFPDDSDAGLVLVGDAGENYFTISNLQFSASKPMKEADEKEFPAPDKKPVEPKRTDLDDNGNPINQQPKATGGNF